MPTPLIAPSVLAADFGHLADSIAQIDSADWVHCDVMDGVFVPNISFGVPVVAAIKKLTDKPLDVHLMIADNDPYLEPFRDAGADHLLVHYESSPHLDRTLTRIRELGMKSGVVLNPHTPVSVLENVLHLTDILLIMSVNPGFGGQSFIPNTLHKIRRAKALIQRLGSQTLIEVDGGITADTAVPVLEAGADVLVAGSYVFKADDPASRIQQLRNARPTQFA